jgi:hypothetical protein
MNINEHIRNNEEELKNPMISPQRRRHLSSELTDLIEYKNIFPHIQKDPTPMELFCGLNPSALECKVFNV